jgi:hypothetical protein
MLLVSRRHPFICHSDRVTDDEDVENSGNAVAQQKPRAKRESPINYARACERLALCIVWCVVFWNIRQVLENYRSCNLEHLLLQYLRESAHH